MSAAAAVAIFDDLKHEELRPLNEIEVDSVRKKFDQEFMIKVLDLPVDLIASGGALELLRFKLSREPSIRGAK